MFKTKLSIENQGLKIFEQPCLCNFILINLILLKRTPKQYSKMELKYKFEQLISDFNKDLEKAYLTESAFIEKWIIRFTKLYNEDVLPTKQIQKSELLATLLSNLKDKDLPNKSFQQFTGFMFLDLLLGGFPEGELVVVGARPSVGKTAFLNSLLVNCIKVEQPALFFSLDSSANRVLNHIISNITDIPYSRLFSKELNKAELEKVEATVELLDKANFQVIDSAFTIDEIILNATLAIKNYGIKVIFIDYLQIIRLNGRRELSREAEISRICRGLKHLAKQYNVAVVISSQLSRAVETRGGDRKPHLSDLRESGAIEQDADKVLFIHRPEYYGIKEDEEGKTTKGVAEIIIAKNRSGQPESYKLNFIGKCAKYTDLSHESSNYDVINAILNLRNRNYLDDDHPF